MIVKENKKERTEEKKEENQGRMCTCREKKTVPCSNSGYGNLRLNILHFCIDTSRGTR